MSEYIIAAKDIGELKQELALNYVAKKVMELTVASSSETCTVWFLPQESAEHGDVFYGLVSKESPELTDVHPAYIENEEDALFVLSVDF